MRNWYFVVIQDEKVKNKIKRVIEEKNEFISNEVEKFDSESAMKFRKFCKNFTIFPTESPVLIVVLTKEYIPMEEKILFGRGSSFSDDLIHQLKYVQNPGMQSLGSGLNTFSLAAVDKGYGSCWLTSANNAGEEILKVLSDMNIETEGYFMGALIAFGKPEEGAKSPKKKSVDDIISII